MKRLFLYTTLLFSLFSCSKEDPIEPSKDKDDGFDKVCMFNGSWTLTKAVYYHSTIIEETPDTIYVFEQLSDTTFTDSKIVYDIISYNANEGQIGYENEKHGYTTIRLSKGTIDCRLNKEQQWITINKTQTSEEEEEDWFEHYYFVKK